jgi:hypothetical protein
MRHRGLHAVLTDITDIDHPRETDEAIVIWLNTQDAIAKFATSLTERLLATDTY